ncbi:MAG: glycerate kinase [Desulfobacteraceae bacterium]|nr:glycerate kinase [Desulfobacteraceae bacterium]
MSIFKAGIHAVDPFVAVKAVLKRDQNDLVLKTGQNEWRKPLDKFKRIFVTGCGKAGAPMVQAVEEIVRDRVTNGLITVKYGHIGTTSPRIVSLVEAGHPFPDNSGIASCSQSLNMIGEATKNDLVIALISGGGSALWPQPVSSICFADKQKTNEILLGCGADIHEINCVRKHLSLVKGGQAARIAAPASVIVLIISDVIGDNLDIIASGPFAPDSSTFADAWKIVEKHKLSSLLPQPVIEHLRSGVLGYIPDTPKTCDPAFEKVIQVLCATNALALEAAAYKAEELGYKPYVLPDPVFGEAQKAARTLVKKAMKLKKQSLQPMALIAGGETTVTLSDADGKGGRNQEIALAAALELDGIEGVIAGSCGTDGNDGPTDAAGAIADGKTVARAQKIGLDCEEYLRHHNAYHFFSKLDDLIITGPTNTNVMDIQCVLIN